MAHRKLFETPKDLEKAIKKYFDYCDSYTIKTIDENGEEVIKHEPKPYTVTGLAYFLGTTRQALINYQNREEYKEVVEHAKTKIEQYAEEKLFTAKNPAGTIFSLKNNFLWKDKQESDVNMNTTIQVIPPEFD